jgi:hypothetical protein
LSEDRYELIKDEEIVEKIKSFDLGQEDAEKKVSKFVQQSLEKEDIKILLILILVNPFFSLLTRLLTSSRSAESKCDNTQFYVLGIYIAVIFFLAKRNTKYILTKNTGQKSTENQLELDLKSSFHIMLGSFFISMLGAAFSVAIALLFTLYLIFIGISSFAASSTSMFMACLCFTNSTILYLIDGRISLWMGIIGSIVIVASSVGTRMTIYQKMMDSGKESILMLFMLILITLAVRANLW